MPSIGELFISLGFDVDDKKLKEFDQALKGTLNTMLELAGVTLSVAGFAKMIGGASDAAAKYKELTKEIGLSAEGMQRFALAANQVNPSASVDQFKGIYENFARKVAEEAEVDASGGVAGPIAILTGKAIRRDEPIDEILHDISQNMPNLEKHQSKGFIARMLRDSGLTEASRPYFDLSEQEIKQRTDSLVVSQEAIDKLSDLSKTFSLASQTISKAAFDFSAKVAPAVGKSAGRVTGLIKAIDEGHGSEYFWEDFKTSLYGRVLGGAKNAIETEYNDSVEEQRALRKSPAARAYLKSRGFSDDDTAAILRGLNSESGIDPTRYGHGAEAKGKAQEAYGIAQWHPDRQATFKSLYGKDIHGSSLADQMEFVNWELTHTHARAARNIRAAAPGDDKFKAFEGSYEVAKWTQNNTFNIHSTADPRVIAKTITDTTHRQLVDAQANLTRGGGG